MISCRCIGARSYPVITGRATTGDTDGADPVDRLDAWGQKTGATIRVREAQTMLEMAKALWSDEVGMTTVEYALLLALLVVSAVGVWKGLGTKMKALVTSANTALTTAGT